MQTAPYKATPYAQQARTWRRLWLAIVLATVALVVPVALVSLYAAAVGIGGGLYAAWLLRQW